MSMPAPFFCIGVTTYQRPKLLRETLESLTSQAFGDFEVIVGNDDPREQVSAEVLGLRDGRLRFVNHRENLGEVANMNCLLAMARGRYFTWLADDDRYAPNFLEVVHDALVRQTYPPCLFTSYAHGLPTNGGKIQGKLREEMFAGKEFVRRYLEGSVKVLGCYGVFETGYLRRIGGMERLGNGFSPYSDNLLAVRQGLLDRVVYIDAPLIAFRTHAASVSWTSKDLDAYSSAQEALCTRCVELLRTESLREIFDFAFYRVLTFYCLEYYYAVVRRRGALDVPRLVSYLRFLRRRGRLLSRPYRYRLWWKASADTIGLLEFRIKVVIRGVLSRRGKRGHKSANRAKLPTTGGRDGFAPADSGSVDDLQPTGIAVEGGNRNHDEDEHGNGAYRNYG